MPVGDGPWVLRERADGQPMLVAWTPLQGDAPRYTSHRDTCRDPKLDMRPWRTTHTSRSETRGE